MSHYFFDGCGFLIVVLILLFLFCMRLSRHRRILLRVVRNVAHNDETEYGVSEASLSESALAALRACGELALVVMLASATTARADMLRVDAGKVGLKYAGTVTSMLPATATAPPTMNFTQGSALPIGSAKAIPPSPGSMSWTLNFTRYDNVTVALDCVAAVPMFDGAEFHSRFICASQP